MLAKIETDASCRTMVAGETAPMRIGYIVRNEAGVPIAKVGRYVGEGTINRAEYLAVIHALRHAIRLGFTVASVRVDSQLVARQINGAYKITDKKLQRMYRELQGLSKFCHFEIRWEPREKNTEADALTHQNVDLQAPLPPIPPGPFPTRPRQLHSWQARRIREVHFKTSDLSLEMVARIYNIDAVDARMIMRGGSYKDASYDGMPNWSAFTGSLDDGTGWPDGDDLDEIIGNPYPYEDEGQPAKR